MCQTLNEELYGELLQNKHQNICIATLRTVNERIYPTMEHLISNDKITEETLELTQNGKMEQQNCFFFYLAKIIFFSSQTQTKHNASKTKYVAAFCLIVLENAIFFRPFSLYIILYVQVKHLLEQLSLLYFLCFVIAIHW